MSEFLPQTPIIQVVLRNFTVISAIYTLPISGRKVEGVRLKLVGVEILGER